MGPIVSIITPMYNSKSFVARAISSVQAQTFSDWELIIIDDNSDDGSAELVESLSSVDKRIKLIKLKINSGAAVARNRGITEAQGRYIAFLDSDDYWLPCKLYLQLEFMEERGVPFVFSSYRKIDDYGNDLGIVKAPSKTSYHDLLKVCVIGCLTVIYDSHVLGKVEMPLIRKRQDFGLWLKLLKITDFAYGLDEVLAIYTVRKGSVSSNKISAAIYQWKIYREFERMPLVHAGYYFANYAVRGLLRRGGGKL